MKGLFDQVSRTCSRNVTQTYSTSFSAAVRMLSPSIRQDIHNIYGFVRLADEIVDSFHGYDRARLLGDFRRDLDQALEHRISLNPILNAFQETAHRHAIGMELIGAFLQSMALDLDKKQYGTREEFTAYVYGSADVVGLMCLLVFTGGDREKYEALKIPAMRLGSAFQKVNFLRDLKDDCELLGRTYFPNADIGGLDERSKKEIVDEIEADFAAAYDGIGKLPIEAKFGVYTAYIYYRRLLSKLRKTPSGEIRNRRIRVAGYEKIGLFARCYFSYKLNLL
jgi:phytoene/squalene synthetase